MAPWACHLGSHTGSHPWKSPTAGLIFCNYGLEVISNFNHFHFSLGPSDLCAWCCLLSSCPFQPCVMFFPCRAPAVLGAGGQEDLTHFCLQGPAQTRSPRGLCVYFGECDETLLGCSPSIKARIPSHGKGCGPACTYSRNSERGGMAEARGIKVLHRGAYTTLLSNVPSWLKALPDLWSHFLPQRSPSPTLADLSLGLWEVG